MCCPCAIQIRRFGQSYGLFLTTQGPESRRRQHTFEWLAESQLWRVAVEVREGRVEGPAEVQAAVEGAEGGHGHHGRHRRARPPGSHTQV